MRFFRTFLPLLLAFLSSPVLAGTLQGQVVAIVSGDTIKVRDEKFVQHTVRLAGLDAPEKFQKFAQRCEDSLRELVFQRYVTVEMAGKGAAPRVGKVMLQGRDIGREQLAGGFAWYDKSHAQDLSAADRQAYAETEADARTRRAGLWRDARPIPPWEYRHGRRK